MTWLRPTNSVNTLNSKDFAKSRGTKRREEKVEVRVELGQAIGADYRLLERQF